MFGANLSTVSATLSISLSVACHTRSFLVPIHTAPLFLLIAIFLASGTTAKSSTLKLAGSFNFDIIFFLILSAYLVS